MKVAELFATIGLKIDQKPLKDFNKNFQSVEKGFSRLPKTIGEASTSIDRFIGGPVKRNLLIFPALLGAAVFAIDRFVDSSVRGAVSLQNFQRQTGLFSADLQRLQIAGQLSDLTLSAEQVTQSVINLQNNLTNVRLGRGDTAGFRLLGIDVIGKDAFQVIEDLRVAIKGIEPAVAINLLERIGLSRQFFNVLRLGKKEFESLGAGIFRTTEQTKVLEELGIAMTKFRLELGLVKDLFVVQLAPFLISGVNLFENFGFATSKVLEVLREFPAVLQAIKIAFGALLVITSLKNPKFAAFSAIILAMDDIISGLRGEESLTGDAGKKLKKLDNFILRASKKNEAALKKDLDLPEKILRTLLIPVLRDPNPRTTPDDSKSNVFNNSFIFHTNENSDEIANKIDNILLKQQTIALSEINNGVVA